MQIAMIGAGTMGATMARRLRVAGHDVVVTDVDALATEGFATAPDLAEQMARLETPRAVGPTRPSPASSPPSKRWPPGSPRRRYDGSVADSGEGRWTVQAAMDVATPVLVLASAVFSRFASRDAGDDAGKVLSAMRSEFGGHRDGCAESAPATEDQS